MEASEKRIHTHIKSVYMQPRYGGILFVSAACMFFAARYFRIAEDRENKDNLEEENT